MLERLHRAEAMLAAIITAVLFFGGVWGFWGVFFAIPLATVVHAVIKAWPRRATATAEKSAGLTY